MCRGVLRSLRGSSWRRAVAGTAALAMLAGTCPVYGQVASSPSLSVVIPLATGHSSVDSAILEQVHGALSIALDDSPHFSVIDTDSLARETEAARAWTSAQEEQVRAAAGRLGAEVALLVHVERAYGEGEGVAVVHGTYRLVDVLSGRVVSGREIAGVSSGAPVGTASKLAEAVNSIARQIATALAQASGMSVGITSPDMQGRVQIGAGATDGVELYSWLMVFRRGEHVGALEVVHVGTASSKAAVRYLKGIRSLTASDRVRFAFAPAPESVAPSGRPTEQEVRKKRRNKTWQTVLGILALVGIVALVSDDDDPPPAAAPVTPPATATTGVWQIASAPAGALIRLDAQTTGRTTPATFLGLSPGAHTATLTLDGFNPLTLTATITAGQTAVTSSSDATLTPTGAPPGAPPPPQ